MLDIKVLGSSSQGNCYILKTSGESLILECGVKYKKIMQALNFNIDRVVGCLVTHEHGDHTKAIRDVLKASIDVYSSSGTFDALGVDGHRVKRIRAKQQFQLGSFTILPFDTKHDAVEPLGYLIYHPEFGKLLFATDTYYIHYTFSGLNYIMIECNYSKELLQRNIEAGTIPEILKRRLLTAHLSLENAKEFFLANNLTQVYEIRLLHLSDGNSNAKQFKNEIEGLTGVPVIVC